MNIANLPSFLIIMFLLEWPSNEMQAMFIQAQKPEYWSPTQAPLGEMCKLMVMHFSSIPRNKIV